MREKIAEVAQQLAVSGVQPEYLCTLSTRRAFPALWRQLPHFSVIALCWRLGALLITADGRIFAAGKGVRAVKRERLGEVSVAQEQRRDLAGFAFASGLPHGAQINYHTHELTAYLEDSTLPLPASAPLVRVGQQLRVLWQPGADVASAPELMAYLHDRSQLLTGGA